MSIDVPDLLRRFDAALAGPGGVDEGERVLVTALAELGGAGRSNAGDDGDRDDDGGDGGARDDDRDGDDGARLTVLNELMGLYRSTSRHEDAVAAAAQALELVERLGVAGTDAGATTLINAATAQRAAGLVDAALATYSRALTVAEATMAPTDRRLAALHNNLSIAHSDRGNHELAATELLAALGILEASSPDPDRDIDIASTCTNLALVRLALGDDGDDDGGDAAADIAADLAARSLAIFASGGHEANPHHASALAGYAQVSVRRGRFADAVDGYRRALTVIANSYGEGSDPYAVTAANLAEAECALAAAAPASGTSGAPEPASTTPRSCESTPRSCTTTPRTCESTPRSWEAGVRGLELARRYWEQHGRPMVEERFPAHRGRIAVGLVGHGSECYGFDDALSRDHDFGPGFCLWLTAADHAEIGAELQAAYDALPGELDGVGPRVESPRAAGRRVGVFEIGAFHEGITGYRAAPTTAHEWLLLEESTLAAATNGAVFADPLGEFSGVRGGFRRMPKDVRLALISRRLGMASQAGQYNLPRMLRRGESEAAWLAVGEFVGAVASLVFLLNKPAAAGYLPYYKWRFAALRRLSARMGSRLPGVADDLAQILRLSSAACFGGAGFGEGGKGAESSLARVEELIDGVCRAVVTELTAQGLTSSSETFLEWQRPHVGARIRDEWLREG